MAGEQSTTKIHSFTSGWAAVAVQVVIFVFYGAYVTFSSQQNKEYIEKINEEKMPIRLQVVETKMEYYDKIIDKMDDMADDIKDVQLQIRDLQNTTTRRNNESN